MEFSEKEFLFPEDESRLESIIFPSFTAELRLWRIKEITHRETSYKLN